MFSQEVRSYIFSHPEKLEWYKKHFPEEFFNNPTEAWNNNKQSFIDQIKEAQEAEYINKMIEEKIAACVEEALKKLLGDL